MFKFEFSNKSTVSIDLSPYPITLSEVKLYSFYFKDNGADVTQDSYIENVLIPKIVRNWEDDTKYLILDQTVKTFVPDLQRINSPDLEMPLNALNVREIDHVKYYPSNWDEEDAKTELTEDEYFFTDELNRTPKSLRIKKETGAISLYPMTNNLEVQFKGGFAGNSFASLNPEIKQALLMQVALAIDVKNGYCDDFYSDAIKEVYAKNSIQEDLISII